ncbi:hypothetical protein EWM64_g4100 [Hericium alpestre]|uniref:Protein kinase domain-containing protein n=1 Tax=Hericium alpestre TaxID=135208 RepID=A0A4Z0A0P2_9AGAM|nr:hypothetical protein EWM64_g4100 [Hericium alpestre]
MALKLIIPSEINRNTSETFTLRDADANASGSAIAFIEFRSTKRICRNDRVNIYRGQLILSLDKPALDVVCKIGFGRQAVNRVANEAHFYLGKLSHLQGVCIPPCHGYFIGNTEEGPTSCIILDYCGEPIESMFMRLEPTFKTAIIHAAIAIHDADVRHGDLEERNVLDYKGLPMIIDFEHADEYECERAFHVDEGQPAPMPDDFACDEIYELCQDLRVWTPAYIQYIRTYQPISLAYDAHKLAATAPSHWSPEEALAEAYRVIVEHVKRYYLEHYDEWKARMDAKAKSRISSAASSIKDL